VDGEEAGEGGGRAAVFALVIDGKSLTYALEGELKPKLLALALQCASVICCRLSPKQKALVCHAPFPSSPGCWRWRCSVHRSSAAVYRPSRRPWYASYSCFGWCEPWTAAALIVALEIHVT